MRNLKLILLIHFFVISETFAVSRGFCGKVLKHLEEITDHINGVPKKISVGEYPSQTNCDDYNSQVLGFGVVFVNTSKVFKQSELIVKMSIPEVSSFQNIQDWDEYSRIPLSVTCKGDFAFNFEVRRNETLSNPLVQHGTVYVKITDALANPGKVLSYDVPIDSKGGTIRFEFHPVNVQRENKSVWEFSALTDWNRM